MSFVISFAIKILISWKFIYYFIFKMEPFVNLCKAFLWKIYFSNYVWTGEAIEKEKQDMQQVFDKHLPKPNCFSIVFLNLSYEFHNKLKIPKIIWDSQKRNPLTR